MDKRIVVIADDLTGANDTGVQFAKQGLKTLVALNEVQLAGIAGCDVLVIDTDSRGLPAGQAYEKVKRIAETVIKGGYTLLYKKVDSTLRGNPGAEIEAIMDACACKLAVVAPAFPKNGRSTIGGYHLLKGAPLEATEIARDPKSPVRESSLITLLSSQMNVKVGHVGIKTMLAGPAAIADAVKAQLVEGIRAIVFDVWQDEQFALLAEAVHAVEPNILWVGSAGLAEALPGLLEMQPPPAALALPCLIIAGSVSNVTRSQVAKLAVQPNTTIIKTDSDKFLDDALLPAYIESCVAKASQALAKGHDVIIASGYDEVVVAKTKQQGSVLGLDQTKTSDRVAAGLGAVVQSVLAAKPALSGMVLTGGDTAISICRALGAYGLKVISEVAVGIPLGLLQGGCCDNMAVVTKAGAFGEENALVQAVRTLKDYHSQAK